jgi:hypothetical protein
MASAQIVFPVPGGPGEVERQPEPGGVALAEPPVPEDEGVVAHLVERLVERAARRRREDHVGEGAHRGDRLDGVAAAAWRRR